MSIDDAGGTLRDIRNDITNFSWSTPRAVQDWTGIDKSAHERGLLLADMSANWATVFNDATNMSHDVFKTISSTSVAREILLNVSGQILGTTPQVTMLLTDYAITRAAGGELTGAVPGVLANGEIPTWTT